MELGKHMESLKDKKVKVGKVDLKACLGDKIEEKLNAGLDELRQVLSVIQICGFSSEKVKISGIGLKIPEILIAVTGSLDNIQPAQINDLMESHKKNKLVCMLLGAMIKVKQISDRVEVLQFKGVRIDVKLGTNPNVDFDLIPA